MGVRGARGGFIEATLMRKPEIELLVTLQMKTVLVLGQLGYRLFKGIPGGTRKAILVLVR